MKVALPLLMTLLFLETTLATFTIDDYAEDVPTLSTSSNAVVSSFNSPVAALWGTRKISCYNDTNSPGTARVGVQDGRIFLSNEDPGSSAGMFVEYGLRTTASGNIDYDLNRNADFSHVTGMAVVVDQASVNSSILIYVHNDEYLTSGFVTYYKHFDTAVTSPTTIFLSTESAFLNLDYNLSIVDKVQVEGRVRNGGSLAISQVSAVPEPGSLAAFTIGFIMLRKKKRQALGNYR